MTVPLFSSLSTMPVGVLMRSPMGVQGDQQEGPRQRSEVRFQRQQSDHFQDLSAGFRHSASSSSSSSSGGGRDFQRQFFHVYSRRLEALRPRVSGRAREAGHRVVPLSELQEVGDGEEVAIVGTVFKNQPLKPNILKELAEDQGLPPQPITGNVLSAYAGEGDELILEDSMQRIRLRGPGADVQGLVTGVVAAFLGQEKESGKFEVREAIFAAPPPQPMRPLFQKDR